MQLAIAFAATFVALGPAPAAAQQATSPPKGVVPKLAQRDFASAEQAVSALVAALRTADRGTLKAVLGPGSADWIFTGDDVADRADWARFLQSFDKHHELRASADGTVTLVTGDDWPFPAPIVKRGGRWTFDAEAGREEVTNRRVGQNELDTIQALLAIVDAEREYAATDPDKNGFHDYARRVVSQEGKRDGLYWPTAAGEPASPLGVLVAQAMREGYAKKDGARVPYHGYYFGLLTSQGKDAPGGAYDYLVGDKLIGGFGVVAYPAKYGVSGVMTFVVNHDGVVWQKDLGPDTTAIIDKTTAFNPGPGWQKAQP